MILPANLTARLGEHLAHARQECFRTVLKYKLRRFNFSGVGGLFSKVRSHHKYKLKWEIFDAAVESRRPEAVSELLKIFDEAPDLKNPLLYPAIDYIRGNHSRATERLVDTMRSDHSEPELKRAACFFLLVVNAYPLPAQSGNTIRSDVVWPHFQFWDEATPKDVTGLMAAFRSQCGSHYEFFDNETARAFLSRHFDHEVTDAFEACYHPAMRCDFFRFCKLYQTGGSYSDADAIPKKAFASARISLAGKPMFWIWDDYRQVGNWFLSATPRTIIYEKLIREAIYRINRRKIEHSIYDITGPHMIADVLFDHCHSFPTDDVGGYTNHFGRWNIQTVGTPKYKHDARNWQLYEKGLRFPGQNIRSEN
jgi:hypothetical protein